MKVKYLTAVGAVLLSTGAAQAAGFVNGGFEAGNASGWTVGGGSRAGQNTTDLNPADYQPGGSRYNASIANTHSSIVGPGLDPTIGAAMGSIVYSGNSAWRVEDRSTGGWVSTISQQVNNYTDANIFFAWKAVLENGGHSAQESAAMIITLRDLTTNTTLISRTYNAFGGTGGVDSRFSQSGSFFYTPQWQIEQLAIDASLSGHNFLLSILGADCGPTGHEGYLYLDGFGSVTPPPVDPGAVPEPATWAMMMLGFGMMGAMLRRRRTTVRFNAVAA